MHPLANVKAYKLFPLLCYCQRRIHERKKVEAAREKRLEVLRSLLSHLSPSESDAEVKESGIVDDAAEESNSDEDAE